MASESAELPVTPGVTTSPVVEKRRYNSIGKASSGKSNEKVVPRYLRASTSSCHDICKYGGHHSFEPKERRAIPDRATRKQLYKSSEASIGVIVAKSKLSVDSKPTKMSTVLLKDAVDSKARTSDATKSFDNQKQVGNNEVKVNRKKTSVVDVKPSLLSKSHTSPSTSQDFSSSDKEVQLQSKSVSRKVEAPPKSTSKMVKTPSKSTVKKVESMSKPTSEVKTSSKSTADSVEAVPKSILKKIENPSNPTASLKKVENPSNSTSKVKTSLKSISKMEGTSSQLPSSNGTEMKLSAKPSTSLNSIRVARKKVSSSMNSAENSGDKRNSKIKMEKKVASSKASPRKLIVPVKALSSPRASFKRLTSLNSKKHKNLKIVSPLKNQKAAKKVELEEHKSLRNQKTTEKVELEEQVNNEVKEKTLYVIKMDIENKTLQSNKNASYDDESYLPQLSTPESSSTSVTQSLSEENQEEYEYTTSESELDFSSGSCEIKCIANKETLKVEPGKVKEVEDKDCEMTKLKFRRGKVVDNQSEKNTPRKLKFRRAKTLVEKANVEEKVVLRHQDIEDKKDAQGLFNNVIEETASKLVGVRKSKVKALVGAFETVISLQEK